MNSIGTLATFLGWCAVINIGFIFLALLVLSVFREGLAALNAKLFGVTREEAKVTLFRVFQHFGSHIFSESGSLYRFENHVVTDA